LRNHDLARLVNVVGDKGQRPEDLYAMVAKAAMDKSAGDTKKKTVVQLKARCKELGLSGYSKLRKAELVERLYDAIPLMRSAEAVRAELDSYDLDANQVKITIERIFDRSVAKKPTMTSAYGSTKSGLRDCFHGKGQKGPAAFWDSNKTPGEKKEDEKKLERMEKKHKITQKYRDICRRMYDPSTDRDEKWRLNAQLREMAKNKNLSNDQFGNYKKYLKETKRIEIWNEESSLRNAILEKGDELHGSKFPSTKREGFYIHLKKHIRPKKPLSPQYVEFLDVRARRQNKLTKLVLDAYYDAIGEVTGRAFVALLEDLSSVANDGVGHTKLLEVMDAIKINLELNGKPPLTTNQEERVEERVAAIFKKHDEDEDNLLYIDELEPFFTSLEEDKDLSGIKDTIKEWRTNLIKSRKPKADRYRFTIHKDYSSIGKEKGPNATQSKGDGLWPGVQWHLPQDEKKGFQVNNYYIKSRDSSKTREGNPFRPESVFSALLPDWYTVKNSPFKGGSSAPRSPQRIKQSMEDEWGNIPGVKKRLDDLLTVSRKKLLPILKYISEQDKGNPSNPERLAEIKEILEHRNISLTKYEDEEWLRIEHKETAPKKMEKHKNAFIDDYVRERRNQRAVQGGQPWTPADEKKAINSAKDAYSEGQLPGSLKDWITNNHDLARPLLANFIQSLDAYHMRRAINRCKTQFDDLSFWAVHDAFGTHARDVGTMAEIVKTTFYEIHLSLRFKGWISPPASNLTLKHILDSEYIIN
jgi:hypothetical protein